MEIARYRECLDADFKRMREVAARDLKARVPSCPDWDVAELVQHTGMVYLHKCMAIQRSDEGKPVSDDEIEWPPPGAKDEEPLALFARAYAELNAEFDKRDPADATGTWFDPDQTVGFWIRRMAQETVIHRVDAELALGESIMQIPDDLAVDGIDEVLVCFLAYAYTKWAHELTEQLKEADGLAVGVRANSSSWIVRATTKGITAETGSRGAAATVSGKPHDVLLWMWRRVGNDAIRIDGDAGLVKQLYELLGPATQ